MSKDAKEAEQDVVEMKKAMATGSASESQTASSSTCDDPLELCLVFTRCANGISTAHSLLLSGIYSHDGCKQGVVVLHRF